MNFWSLYLGISGWTVRRVIKRAMSAPGLTAQKGRHPQFYHPAETRRQDVTGPFFFLLFSPIGSKQQRFRALIERNIIRINGFCFMSKTCSRAKYLGMKAKMKMASWKRALWVHDLLFQTSAHIHNPLSANRSNKTHCTRISNNQR